MVSSRRGRCSALKKDSVLTPATTWLGVADITLHGLSRLQKDKRRDPTHEGHGEQGGGLGAGWGRLRV